jgi:hypothetical protein
LLWLSRLLQLRFLHIEQPTRGKTRFKTRVVTKALLRCQNCSRQCIGASRPFKEKKPEIWPTYTDAWDYQRRFRSAYEVARLNRSELLLIALPEEVDKLLDRLREAGRRVDDGHEPDEDELERIATALRRIVRDLKDLIGPPRKS